MLFSSVTAMFEVRRLKDLFEDAPLTLKTVRFLCAGFLYCQIFVFSTPYIT